MLKKAKADKPKAEKFKPEKPEKAAKGDKAGGDKGKGGQADYFWVTWQKNRAKKKANVRESSLPKPTVSKEEKLKLILSLAIVFVIVPTVIFIVVTINARHDAAVDLANKGPTR